MSTLLLREPTAGNRVELEERWRQGSRLEVERRLGLGSRVELERRAGLGMEQGKWLSLFDVFIIDNFDRLRYLCCVETYVSSLFTNNN